MSQSKLSLHKLHYEYNAVELEINHKVDSWFTILVNKIRRIR